MKVTIRVASRWVKAAFLIIFGLVLLMYTDRFIEDLRANLESSFDLAFESTWDLMRILMWIFVAWLLVDGILTIALSFSEHRYTLLDVIKRLDVIETRVGISNSESSEESGELMAEAMEERGEEPPPPRE